MFKEKTRVKPGDPVKIIGGSLKGKFGKLQRYLMREGEVTATIRLGKGSGRGCFRFVPANSIIPDRHVEQNARRSAANRTVDNDLYLRHVTYNNICSLCTMYS